MREAIDGAFLVCVKIWYEDLQKVVCQLSVLNPKILNCLLFKQKEIIDIFLSFTNGMYVLIDFFKKKCV